MVRYLFYTIGDLTYQSPLVERVGHCCVYISVYVAIQQTAQFKNIFAIGPSHFSLVTQL